MKDITLGTDPELVFIGTEKGNKFPKLLRVTDYYERQRGHQGQNPEIGADGHPYTVEMRPPPATSPKQLVSSIRDILERHQFDVPKDTCWQAGSFVEVEHDGSYLPEGKPIGGHLHVGNVPRTEHLTLMLDGVLAQFAVLLEDQRGARKRRMSNYGKLSDIRRTPWGFEYRTLASWILSPSISLGILSLFKAIVIEERENFSQSLAKQRGHVLKTLTSIDREVFCEGEKEYFLKKLPTIWDVISRFRYWTTAEGRPMWQYVCLLKHVATSYPDWHNEKDILHRWGIRNYTPPAYLVRRPLSKSVINTKDKVNLEQAYNLIFND